MDWFEEIKAEEEYQKEQKELRKQRRQRERARGFCCYGAYEEDDYDPHEQDDSAPC